MPRVNYSFTALLDADVGGDNIVAAQAITIKNQLDNSIPVLYSGETGAGTLSNPNITDAGGVFSFWIDPGIYIIESGARQEIEWVDDGSRLNPLTTALMAASKHIRLGEVVTTKEFATGTGGGGVYDTVLTSSVTPNPYNVIQGVGSALNSFVLRSDNIVDVRTFGAVVGADSTGAIQAAADSVGINGGLIISGVGTYEMADGTITCGYIKFDRGALLSPTVNNILVIDAEVIAGNFQCFDAGSPIYALDCEGGTTALRSWWSPFTASDVGEDISFPQGGVDLGGTPPATTVTTRLRFTTTIASYIDDLNVTLTDAIITGVRQDYVIDDPYNTNTGVAIIGQGEIKLIPSKTSIVNIKWFGAVGDGVTDDSRAIRSALHASTRESGGCNYFFPDGFYGTGDNICVDVQGTRLYSNNGRATIFRLANIPFERMNLITCVWRGRYGGGAPSKLPDETWTWGGATPVFQGDWFKTQDIEFNSINFNGNSGNQASLPAGTGLDGYDSAISTLYTQRCRVINCNFANVNRWGVAFSTVSDDSFVTGCRADSCAEGAWYAETSDNIKFTNNISYNSPGPGWNLGAATFLNIDSGVISGNIIRGGNYGIYIRNLSENISVTGNTIVAVSAYGIWLNDESNGSNRGRVVQVTGNTILGGTHGIHTEWTNRINVTGNTIEDCSQYGIWSGRNNNSIFNDNLIYNSTLRDIIVTVGTTFNSYNNNQADVELTGTSSLSLDFKIPIGFTFTDSSSGTNQICVTQGISLGDNLGHFRSIEGFQTPTGAGNWQVPPFIMGNVFLWVDGSARLRIKTGAPTSDTDGAVVGTQT